MKCPHCSSSMEVGELTFESDLWGHESHFNGFESLYFRKNGKERVWVADAGSRRVLFYCAGCGGAFVTPAGTKAPRDPNTPAECGQCGVTLKPGRTDCHWCGGCAET